MPDPKKKVFVKVVKDKNGAKSTRTEETVTTPGTPEKVIKGTSGSPAVLPSKGVKGGDEFNKAFGEAKSSGKESFSFKGKKFKVKMSGTKGKPAVPPTPDTVIPGTPPKTETKVKETPIPSNVYKVNAVKGTIGGAKREGIGGGITTDSQVTSNKEVADRAEKAQGNYNSHIDNKYAPDTKNDDGLNPAQLAAKNAKAEKRRKELKGTTSVSTVDVQSGLERKKTEELRDKKGKDIASL